MIGGQIGATLKNFGLTNKEVGIYLCLGRGGTMKSSDIQQKMRISKGEVYRILKRLQKKGLVEVILEHPYQFEAVPLERTLDLFIRQRLNEVSQLEHEKEKMVSEWKNMENHERHFLAEKFSVIQGEKKIFNKISQMIAETKKQFFSISTVSSLLKAEQFGIFEQILDHPLKSKIKFRFITEITQDNGKYFKVLLEKISEQIDIKGKEPDFMLSIFPKMIMRDKKEIIIYISNGVESEYSKRQAYLCTNCKSIIECFYGVFRIMWQNGTDIDKRMKQLNMK